MNSDPHRFLKLLITLCVMFALLLMQAAVPDRSAADEARPRLLVVVSVDQLAYEYLQRFRANFAADGFFVRAEREGAWYSECHHRHAFTVTGPGHAVIMTG